MSTNMSDFPRVMIKDGSVYIATHIDHPGADYEFSLEHCRTPDDVARWAHQLAQKTWVDKALLVEFIETVYRHYGWGF